MIKRFAARALRDRGGRKYLQSVVELDNGVVQCFYPLIRELPATIWLDGEIVLSTCSNLDKCIEDVAELAAYSQNIFSSSSSFCFAYHLTKRGNNGKLIRLL